ncbi:MAG TPA: hypothetical protein VF148_03920 [Acidimicrobiia bacterium]
MWSRYRTLLLGLGALTLVAILVGVALLREPVTLDPSTPEGTVQAYLQALADAEYETAWNLIDPESKEHCVVSDLALTVSDRSFAAVIGDATINDGTAVVPVTMSDPSTPGPFDPGQNGFETVFALVTSDGGWMITDDPWPYFEWRCDE